MSNYSKSKPLKHLATPSSPLPSHGPTAPAIKCRESHCSKQLGIILARRDKPTHQQRVEEEVKLLEVVDI